MTNCYSLPEIVLFNQKLCPNGVQGKPQEKMTRKPLGKKKESHFVAHIL